MFGIGLPEMILILALALIVVGPDKLPDLARSLAKGILELKKTAEGLKNSFADEGNPLSDIRPELEDVTRSLKTNLLESPTPDRQQDSSPAGVNPPQPAAAAKATNDVDAEYTAVSPQESSSSEAETDGAAAPAETDRKGEEPVRSKAETDHGHQ